MSTRKPLSEKTKAALRKKAEGSRFTYGQLAQVYRRGQGAYLSSGSRNVPMAETLGNGPRKLFHFWEGWCA